MAHTSPHIQRKAAASRCWLNAALAEVAMSGMDAMPRWGIITLYHEAFVKMDIAMANVTISNIVTMTMMN